MPVASGSQALGLSVSLPLPCTVFGLSLHLPLLRCPRKFGRLLFVGMWRHVLHVLLRLVFLSRSSHVILIGHAELHPYLYLRCACYLFE